MKNSLAICTAALAFSFASQGFAQEPSRKPRSATSSTTQRGAAESTRSFIVETAQRGLVEVELARLIELSSGDPAFKSYARTIADDHDRLDRELVRLATQRGVDIPAGPGTEGERVLAELQSLHGADLEAAFKDKMIEDHRRDLVALHQIADGAATADLRGFAVLALPATERHLALARELVPGRTVLYGVARLRPLPLLA